MDRVPEPPPAESIGSFVPGPPQTGEPPVVSGLEATSVANKRGAPVWAVLLITLEATLLVCISAVVVVLALFGEELATKAGGTAATITAGVGPMASSSGFYYMLDSGYYSYASETLDADMASEYPIDRLREEWQALEESEGRVLPLPTNVQINGNKAVVSILLTASRTNRTFGVELTLERGSDETWYIVAADPSLIPAP